MCRGSQLTAAASCPCCVNSAAWLRGGRGGQCTQRRSPWPCGSLLRLLLPTVIFRVQAHICCAWTARGIGSPFRALGLGCRGGKSSPGRPRRSHSYMAAGGQLGRTWQICSQTIWLRSQGILPQRTGSDRLCAMEER